MSAQPQQPNTDLLAYAGTASFSDLMQRVKALGPEQRPPATTNEQQELQLTPAARESTEEAQTTAETDEQQEMQPPPPATMLDHALDALRRGFCVFPCLPGRKDPATENG